jgi:hypothetical protein
MRRGIAFSLILAPLCLSTTPAEVYIFYSESLSKKLLELIFEYVIGIVNEQKQD